jgi:hypothetical protein
MSLWRHEGFVVSDIIFKTNNDWEVIDGDVCRVKSFKPQLSCTDKNGKIHSEAKNTPYAIIELDCKRLQESVHGYIFHKIDFEHLWQAFLDRTGQPDEEINIVWSIKYYKGGVKLFSKVMPKLWVMICKKGSYEIINYPERYPEITGKEWFDRTKPIIDWKPEVFRY